MSKLRTHYDNLQVKENASAEVIKGAYRYLSQKWHPDKNPEKRQEAERVLRIINRAYSVLSDPTKRKDHDDWIARQRTSDHLTQSTHQSASHNQQQNKDEESHEEFFRRVVGHLQIDPSGRSPLAFEKVGRQAMAMFFSGDAEHAFEYTERFISLVDQKYGPLHADVGRANLLGASMMALSGQYEFARQTCEVALKALNYNRSVAVSDLKACNYLHNGLLALDRGERPATEGNYLISKTTPIGRWLWRLHESQGQSDNSSSGEWHQEPEVKNEEGTYAIYYVPMYIFAAIILFIMVYYR